MRRGRIALRRERVVTADGDFLDLDWLDGPTAAPVVLVLHGLEGSARSHYVVGLLRLARARGWRGVVMHFRSCSGELNRQPRFYHSGETRDLSAVVDLLVGREPEVRIGAWERRSEVTCCSSGWASGATDPRAAPRRRRGSRCPSTSRRARGGSTGACTARVYAANFLRTHAAQGAGEGPAHPGFVDVAAVRRARTFAEYDRAGHRAPERLRRRGRLLAAPSSGPYLASIRRPTLLIGALDDPIVPAASLPDPSRLPPHVRAEFLPAGGHAGFLEGPWAMTSWAERRALDFLTAVVDGGRIW